MFFAALLAAWLLVFSQGVASQELLEQLPNCALICFVNGISDSSCRATNTTCLCNDPVFNANVTACVLSACTVKESLTTQNITQVMCEQPVRDRSGTLRAIIYVTGSLAIAAIAIRFGVKISKRGPPLGGDDYIIAIALVLALGTAAAVVVCSYQGLGKDLWNLEFEDITRVLHTFYVIAILYKLATAAIKVGLLCFYLRIFTSKFFRFATYGFIVFNICVGITFALADALHCKPASYFWHQWDGEHEGSCANFNAISWTHSSLNIVLDLVMLVLPIREVYKLKMPRKRKFGVGLMFVVGSFITVLSALRCQSLVQFAKTNNPSWDFYSICVWSAMEGFIGIVCACMPSFHTLLRMLFPKQFASQYSKKYSSGMYGANSQSQNGDIKISRSYSVNFDQRKNKNDDSFGSAIDLVGLPKTIERSDVERPQPIR